MLKQARMLETTSCRVLLAKVTCVGFILWEDDMVRFKKLLLVA
jgi:hypothetical protein